MRALFILCAAASLPSCSEAESADRFKPISEERAATFTLYRNSDISRDLRIQWATFDADDMPGYNLNNCKMAARLLNANLLESAKAIGMRPDQSVGFWCEEGTYRESGDVPLQFEAAFPTDIE